MRQPPIAPDPLRSPSDSGTDTLLMVVIGLALAASALVWLVGQVAAMAFGAHHPIGLGAVGHAAGAVPTRRASR